MSNEMDPLVTIVRRLREMAEQLGVELVDHNFKVDEGGTNHFVVAVFALPAELEAVADLPPELQNQDPELAAMVNDIWGGAEAAEKDQLRQATREAEDEKVVAARERMLDLQKRMKEGRSILDDD